jgi:hypothetical protein
MRRGQCAAAPGQPAAAPARQYRTDTETADRGTRSWVARRQDARDDDKNRDDDTHARTPARPAMQEREQKTPDNKKANVASLHSGWPSPRGVVRTDSGARPALGWVRRGHVVAMEQISRVADANCALGSNCALGNHEPRRAPQRDCKIGKAPLYTPHSRFSLPCRFGLKATPKTTQNPD